MFWFKGRDQELSELRARLAIARAEIESLSAVVARDRMRVQAETAEYARRKANAEGTHGLVDESIRRFSA